MLVVLFSSSFRSFASLSPIPKRALTVLIFFGDCGEMHFDFIFG